MALSYIYTVTTAGWSCVKAKNGEDIGFIRNKRLKPGQTAEQDAIDHARKVLKAAANFNRTPPEIFGVVV